jgi:hypothetical protein
MSGQNIIIIKLWSLIKSKKPANFFKQNVNQQEQDQDIVKGW